jgi:allantoinase
MSLRQRALYSPSAGRPPIAWPANARVAVWVSPNIEHYEYIPALVTARDPWPRTTHPDVQQYTYRDYGNRVGVWRLMALLRELEIPPTFSLNSGVLDLYPELIDIVSAPECAVMGHGVFNTAYIDHLTRAEERDWLESMVADIESRTGKRVRGTLGPGISASVHTPDLLAELGLSYQAEWVLDDQPSPILVSSGRLISMPYTFELNDARMIGDPCSPDDFYDACWRQFRTLYEEGSASGQVMCIALHTFISGQPHMIPTLRRLLEAMKAFEHVWFTTADTIADWYLDNSYDGHRQFAVDAARGAER